MRLADMDMWVQCWALPETYAGVPGKGAVDAWYEVPTKTLTMKLNGKEHCGGVADIAKFFDQIRRPLIYKLAEAAGMPPKVLRAYRGYLEISTTIMPWQEESESPIGKSVAYHRGARSQW